MPADVPEASILQSPLERPARLGMRQHEAIGRAEDVLAVTGTVPECVEWLLKAAKRGASGAVQVTARSVANLLGWPAAFPPTGARPSKEHEECPSRTALSSRVMVEHRAADLAPPVCPVE